MATTRTVAAQDIRTGDRWDDAYRQGREMTLDHALEYAQDAIDGATEATDPASAD